LITLSKAYHAEEFRAGKVRLCRSSASSHSHTASAGWLGKPQQFQLTVSTVSLRQSPLQYQDHPGLPDHTVERRIMRSAALGTRMMQLSKFRNLIAIMPVDYQSSTSKRSTWEKHLSGNEASDALLSVLDAFSTGSLVILSRRDLRDLAHKSNLAQFVMATIVWGYTSGGRGNNVKNLMCNLDRLTQLLSEACTQPVADWNDHYKKVKNIKGLGPSTYTKFLNFLSVKVHGYAALILDDRIIRC
jgi:hypothetical protein